MLVAKLIEEINKKPRRIGVWVSTGDGAHQKLTITKRQALAFLADLKPDASIPCYVDSEQIEIGE